MTPEQAKALADTHIALLLGNDAIEDVAKAVVATLPQLKGAPQAFLSWIQTITAPVSTAGALAGEQAQLYRERMQKLNALLAKDPTFCETIAEYHEWKNARRAPEQAGASVDGVLNMLRTGSPFDDVVRVALVERSHFSSGGPESLGAWDREFTTQMAAHDNRDGVLDKLKARVIDGKER